MSKNINIYIYMKLKNLKKRGNPTSRLTSIAVSILAFAF